MTGVITEGFMEDNFKLNLKDGQILLRKDRNRKHLKQNKLEGQRQRDRKGQPVFRDNEYTNLIEAKGFYRGVEEDKLGKARLDRLVKGLECQTNEFWFYLIDFKQGNDMMKGVVQKNYPGNGVLDELKESNIIAMRYNGKKRSRHISQLDQYVTVDKLRKLSEP